MKRIISIFIAFLFSQMAWAVGDSTIVVTLSTEVGTTHNEPKFTMEIHFDTFVWDIDETNIRLINARADNIRIGSVYGQNWIVDIWPSQQGLVGVYIPAGITKNNPDDDTWNAASDTLWVYIDYSRPSFNLTSTAPNPTIQTQIDVNIKSNEYVTDFIQDDIFVENANVVSFTAVEANHEWNLELAVIQDGDIKVCIPEAKALDTAANINFATDTLKRRFDTSPPNVAISSDAQYLTNILGTVVDILFDEEIEGFDTTDFYLDNAKLMQLIDLGNNKTYEATIEPIVDGEYSIAVLENAVLDILGNNNTPSDTLSFVYDGNRPTCILLSTEPSPTADDTLSFEVEFNENVSNLTTDDIYISGGKIINFKNTVSGISWTYDIVNTATGSIRTYIYKEKVNDGAGNLNFESNSITIETDHTSPTCSLFTTEANPTNKDSVLIRAGFSEPIVNFGIEDIAIVGGTIAYFSKDSTKAYSFYAYPVLGQSVMIIDVLDSSYNDLLGHFGSKFVSLFMQYDIDRPTVMVESSLGNIVHSPFVARFKFNETVHSFIADSIHIENGQISGVYESQSSLEWSATITPIEKGLVNIWLSENAAADLAENKSMASEVLVVDFNDDVYSPTPTISSDIESPTNRTFIPITIEFDEEVTGFTLVDVVVNNAISSNFQQVVANKKWRMNLIPTIEGWIQVEIKSSICEDLSGNVNVKSNILQWQVDMTPPTVNVSTTTISPTNSPDISYRFDFSELVDSFDINDIIVENGTLADFSEVSSSKLWSANLSSIDSDGIIKVYIPENVAYDIGGNTNPLSDTISIVYDGTVPVANLLTYLSSDTTYTDTATVIILFSEPVTGFEIASISLYNADVVYYAEPIFGLEYHIRLKTNDYGVFGLKVPNAIVSDAVGNVNPPRELVFYYVQESSSVQGLKEAGVQHYVFNRTLYLNYQKTILQADKLTIYNLHGQEVFSKELFGQTNFSIPLVFNTGIYVIKLQQKGKFFVDKIFVGKE